MTTDNCDALSALIWEYMPRHTDRRRPLVEDYLAAEALGWLAYNDIAKDYWLTHKGLSVALDYFRGLDDGNHGRNKGNG